MTQAPAAMPVSVQRPKRVPAPTHGPISGQPRSQHVKNIEFRNDKYFLVAFEKLANVLFNFSVYVVEFAMAGM